MKYAFDINLHLQTDKTPGLQCLKDLQEIIQQKYKQSRNLIPNKIK